MQRYSVGPDYVIAKCACTRGYFAERAVDLCRTTSSIERWKPKAVRWKLHIAVDFWYLDLTQWSSHVEWWNFVTACGFVKGEIRDHRVWLVQFVTPIRELRSPGPREKLYEDKIRMWRDSPVLLTLIITIRRVLRAWFPIIVNQPNKRIYQKVKEKAEIIW